jgi:hypothetical protein
MRRMRVPVASGERRHLVCDRIALMLEEDRKIVIPHVAKEYLARGHTVGFPAL